MTARGSASLTALGFLTIIEGGDKGLVGGYLLLNAAGRPLEFHCTSPVKPNRAQEILYGPTLLPYLYGEQIAPALLVKAKTQPRLIFVELADALSARAQSPAPVALVMPEKAEGGTAKQFRIDGPHAGLELLEIGARRLALAEGQEGDLAEVTKVCQDLAAGFDLSEPFARIREALEETFVGRPS